MRGRQNLLALRLLLSLWLLEEGELVLLLLNASAPAPVFPILLIIACAETKGLATSMVHTAVNTVIARTEQNRIVVCNMLTKAIYFICFGLYYFICICIL